MKSIEGLSVCFTAGVGVGVTFSGSLAWEASSAALVLAAVPIILQRRLPLLPSRLSLVLILGCFLLLGIFSGMVAGLPSAYAVSLPESWAQAACGKLKWLIAGIPFPSEGTVPLLTALLTGDRSGLAGETVQAFRESGASHILALSGLHMGILYVLLDRLGRPAGQSPRVRKIRGGIIVLATGLFTFVTGASPSLVRAFLFIAINETLRLSGRPGKPTRVLCLALLIQLVLDPAAIKSTGFQLSYLAMAGIFLLYPLLEAWYPPSPAWDPLRRIWKGAALSISCQIFTAPLVWLRFHSFPQYFLLTNLVALPLTTALMSCAAGTVVLAAAGVCPGFLINATDTLCQGLQRTLKIIASM